jgi:hypothetical protein
VAEEEQAHQVKMASIYLHIKTLLDEEIEEAHITAIAGQIINLKNRMKMSTFEITLLLIKIVNDLENIIKENSEIEKIEKLLVEKEKKAKDTKTRKSGWAIIEGTEHIDIPSLKALRKIVEKEMLSVVNIEQKEYEGTKLND